MVIRVKYSEIFNPNDELHFFGDMMNEGENDYPLAKAIEEMGGYTHHVRDFRHTWSILNKMCN